MGLPGTITIIKNTVPNGPQDFNFTIVGPNLPSTPFALDDDADPTLPRLQGFSNLSPGVYTIQELPVAGYSLIGIAGATSLNLITGTATVTLVSVPGAEPVVSSATVTFTNMQRSGTLTIIKDTVPDGPQDFNFTISHSVYQTTLPLDDDADSTIPNNWVMFGGLLPDTYTITEAPVAGYSLTSIAGATSSDLGTGTATVVLTLDAPSATVLFTNTGEPGIHLVKSVSPTGAVLPGTRLTYTLNFTNTGTAATSPDTRVTDVLDNFLDETTLSNISGWGGSHTHANRTITWTVGSIAPGGSWGVTFSVNVRAILNVFLLVHCTKKVVVYHHNFFIGYPNGTFQPDGNVTRAEVAAAMSRALGLGWTSEPSGFST